MKQQSSTQVQKVTITKPPYEDKHRKACNDNGITIYYQALNNYSGNIVINDNGVPRVGNQIYKDMSAKFKKDDKRWWKVVEALYVQEYFKLPEGLREIRLKEIDLEIILIETRKANEKQKG